MAVNENLIGKINIPNSVDHSLNQFKFLTATGVLAAANGVDAIGVLQDAIDGSINGPKPMEVGYLGGSKVKVDGSGTAIVIGSRITTNASALGITKPSFSTGDRIFGTALEPSNTANDIIKVLLLPIGEEN